MWSAGQVEAGSVYLVAYRLLPVAFSICSSKALLAEVDHQLPIILKGFFYGVERGKRLQVVRRVFFGRRSKESQELGIVKGKQKMQKQLEASSLACMWVVSHDDCAAV